MARKPRIQFPRAIYHIVTRGEGRQLLFHDDRHYEVLPKASRQKYFVRIGK